MRLTVPFQYKLTYVAPRKRKETHVFVRSSVDVEIEEAADPVVVMRYLHARHAQHLEGVLASPRVDLVDHGGSLWRNAIVGEERKANVDDLRAAVVVESDRAFEALVDVLSLPFDARAFGMVPGHAKRVESPREVEIGRVVSDDREEVVDRIREIVKGLMIHDGLVFRKTEEPLFKTTSVKREDGQGWSFGVVPELDRSKYDKESLMRADRIDEMAGHLELNGRFEREVFFRAAPELLRPDLLRYDDRAADFRRMARKIRETLEKRRGDHAGAFQAFRVFDRLLPELEKDLRNVVPNVKALTRAARDVEDILGESHFMGLGFFLKIGEGELADRLKDTDALDGVYRPFGDAKLGGTVFEVALDEKADEAALKAALLQAGAISVVSGGPMLEVRVPGTGMEATEALDSLLEKAREIVYPPQDFSL